MTIYTLGYSGWRLEDVAVVVRELDALVVDVRFVPSSRMPGFRKESLAAALGDRYVWLKGFGNVNYQGGAPTLADYEGATAELRRRLGPVPRNVILLCACRQVSVCHRKIVAEKLAAEWGGVVAHLEPPGGGGGEGEPPRPRAKTVLPGKRYHVTVITRPKREPPFQLRVRDRLTGRVTREALRGLTVRQKGRAYERAAEREYELNTNRRPERVWLWAEAREEGLKLVSAEQRPATVEQYSKALDAMERYAAQTLRNGRLEYVEQVDVPLARGFGAWRRTHGLRRDGKTPTATVAAATVNRDLRQLHAFWKKYLGPSGLVAENPWHEVPKLREFAREPIRLTLEQRSRLLKAAEGLGVKFHAACALACDCGPRVEELCHVTWGHIDTKARVWLITKEPCGWMPKGTRERRVPFGEEAARRLTKWRASCVEALTAQGVTDEDACTIIDAGRVFGTGSHSGPDNWQVTFNAMLAKACLAAGLPKITCHNLRFTIGRLLAEAGAAPLDIRDLLGHRAIQTTLRYVGDSQARGAEAAFSALSSKMCAKGMPKPQEVVAASDVGSDVTIKK